MSETMARQGGQVQLEQSDMSLTLNMAKIAKGGFSRSAIEETRYLIKRPHVEVWEEKMLGFEFPGHKKVKAVIERHPAMLPQNHTDGCLSCHNGTPKNPQTCWRRTGTGAPLPKWCRQPTPELTPQLTGMPPLPGMPRAPPGNVARAQCSEIINLLAGYMYAHTCSPSPEFFTLDAYAQDSQHDTDFDPDMLTDDGTSTGLYTICCVGMQ